jgi:tellurite resistance protein TehA-like permease
MSTDEIRAKVRSIERESSRRSAVIVGSGVMIVPSWLAVAWYLPDFRLLATVGVATALWILYHVRRNTAVRRLPVDATSRPSLPFYRELLERELNLHRRLPVWFLPPVALSTAAIALTFYTSERFAHTPAFFAMMAWIVGGAGLALVIGLKRSRREADRCRRELDALGS